MQKKNYTNKHNKIYTHVTTVNSVIYHSSIIGILPVDVSEGECPGRLWQDGRYYDAVSVKHGLIISVSVTTIKMKGILVFAPRRVFGPKIFIVPCCFSL